MIRIAKRITMENCLPPELTTKMANKRPIIMEMIKSLCWMIKDHLELFLLSIMEAIVITSSNINMIGYDLNIFKSCEAIEAKENDKCSLPPIEFNLQKLPGAKIPIHAPAPKPITNQNNES